MMEDHSDIVRFAMTVFLAWLIMAIVRVGITILAERIKAKLEEEKAREQWDKMEALLRAYIYAKQKRDEAEARRGKASNAYWDRVNHEANHRTYSCPTPVRKPANPVQEKIDRLLALAERPGTPEEGAAALHQAQRLADKHNIKLTPHSGNRWTHHVQS